MDYEQNDAAALLISPDRHARLEFNDQIVITFFTQRNAVFAASRDPVVEITVRSVSGVLKKYTQNIATGGGAVLHGSNQGYRQVLKLWCANNVSQPQTLDPGWIESVSVCPAASAVEADGYFVTVVKRSVTGGGRLVLCSGYVSPRSFIEYPSQPFNNDGFNTKLQNTAATGTSITLTAPTLNTLKTQVVSAFFRMVLTAAAAKSPKIILFDSTTFTWASEANALGANLTQDVTINSTGYGAGRVSTYALHVPADPIELKTIQMLITGGVVGENITNYTWNLLNFYFINLGLDGA